MTGIETVKAGRNSYRMREDGFDGGVLVELLVPDGRDIAFREIANVGSFDEGRRIASIHESHGETQEALGRRSSLLSRFRRPPFPHDGPSRFYDYGDGITYCECRTPDAKLGKAFILSSSAQAAVPVENRTSSGIYVTPEEREAVMHAHPGRFTSWEIYAVEAEVAAVADTSPTLR